MKSWSKSSSQSSAGFASCRRRFWGSAIGLAIGCFTGGSLAAPATFVASHYAVQRWEAEAGLPENTVTGAVQTRDSYLWLGTYSGLARFDGVRFTVFDDSNTPGLASSRVTCLFEADDGTLWIGHETGGLTRYRDGRFEPVEIKAAWPGGKIQELATDTAGDLWVLHAAGQIMRVRDGLVLTPETGGAADLVSMTRSPRGIIWIARNGRVSTLDQGKLTPLDFGSPVKITGVLGIGASQDGALWVVMDGQIRKWTGTTWAERPTIVWNNTPVFKLIETRKGVLAAGNPSRGVCLVLPTADHPLIQLNRTNGFASDWVIALCEDREGNIWAGTGGGGLAVIRPASFQTVSPPDQWQGRAVLSVCASRDRSLWIGTEGAGLYQLYEDRWNNFSVLAGIQNPYVWSVAEDSRDGLWIGTWNSGLLLRRGDYFDRVDGLPGAVPHMTAILCSVRGGLWVGTGNGLMRYEGGKSTWFNRNEKSGGESDVRAVVEDNDGTVWFGMSGGGLGCLKLDGSLRYFRRADGLASDYIGCLRLEDDGTLWIGTLGGGLTRLRNGHFATLNWKQGLPNGFICDIEDDGRGCYWMSSHAGVLRASKADLTRCADGTQDEIYCRTFGIADGLPTLKCSDGLQPAGCKTVDGRLWFSTSRGLVTVNPREVESNPLPPPVTIEHLRLDSQTITFEPAAEQPLKISPGRHRFEFRYTGLSFVGSEKILFKHRLQGLDKDWVSAGTTRTANYSYVPPGNYRFEVIACNNDGVWNETGDRVTFTVLPFFWQTAWFRVLAAGIGLALAGGIVWFETRRRMRRKFEMLEHQRAVENERARIAKDIHDDLGATLTRITMLSDPVRSEQDEPVQATGNISQIHSSARELTRSMDEIVWAINPQHDTLDGLVTYLEKFAQDFLGTAGVRCRLDLPLDFPAVPLTAEARHNLYLSFKEALNNVIKHSGATEVGIVVTATGTDFAITIKDNGHGFLLGANSQPASRDPARSAAGNGLVNMRRRLEAIGGRCDIHSSPGLGAKITFVVNIAGPPR